MNAEKLRVRGWDWLIPGAALLLAVGVLLFCLLRPQPKRRVAEVKIDGKTVAVLSLTEDTEQRFSAKDGYNEVTVRDGRVSVTEADCDTQVCVHHRAVWRTGESIVCAPHGLVVTVVGEGDSPDLIVG